MKYLIGIILTAVASYIGKNYGCLWFLGSDWVLKNMSYKAEYLVDGLFGTLCGLSVAFIYSMLFLRVNAINIYQRQHEE